MDLFGQLATYGYGALHVVTDAASGLRAVVAVHDTRLGPALGGCRCLSYEREQSAIVDALRLARSMTYKAALAGVAHGGGKAVILKPRGHFDRGALFRAFGRFLESLGGRYITGEDSGTELEDMRVIQTVTRHVTGVASGDPAPSTALGVRRGIEACARSVLGRSDLRGLHVVVQGVGHAGSLLCRELHAHGVRLTVADVDVDKAERIAREFQAQSVSIEHVFDVECDVFAPCALGSALNDRTVPRLRCRVVAGAANDQLAEAAVGEGLHRRGIVYAPDYAINAGGVIHLADEVLGYDPARARRRILSIYDTIYEICERSRRTQVPTYRVADALVEERLAAAPPQNAR